MTLRLQSSERGPPEWANFASFATVTGGAKKEGKGGKLASCHLERGKKFVLRRSSNPFSKREEEGRVCGSG